jgi:hypothetical protein
VGTFEAFREYGRSSARFEVKRLRYRTAHTSLGMQKKKLKIADCVILVIIKTENRSQKSGHFETQHVI